MTHLAKLGLVLILLAGCKPSFTAADARTRLVFKVGEPGAPVAPNELEIVRSVVELRLRSIEVLSAVIVEANAPDELVVLTPTLTDAQLADVQDLVTRPGTLEFALLANTRDHAELIAAAQAAEAAPDVAEPPQYAWVPVKTGADGQPVAFPAHDSIVIRATEQNGQPGEEVLVVFDPPDRRVTDKLLKRAFQDYGENGTPTLGFELNTQGAHLMKRLTTGALPTSDGFKRRIGIILDGKMLSAPTINGAIESRGVIEGDFTVDEINHMVTSFNIGRLPAPVEFVEAMDVQEDNR